MKSSAFFAGVVVGATSLGILLWYLSEKSLDVIWPITEEPRP